MATGSALPASATAPRCSEPPPPMPPPTGLGAGAAARARAQVRSCAEKVRSLESDKLNLLQQLAPRLLRVGLVLDLLPLEPPAPPADFVVNGDDLVMSDGSAIGSVLTRSGRHEVYKLRKDGVALDIDSWFRRTFGVRRCYLLDDHKAVIGAIRVNTFATNVIPERPLLPVSRSTSGPLHPVDARVRAAAARRPAL